MLVHPLTSQPTEAWKELSKSKKVIKIKNKIPSNPIADNKVRIVCMSDTHSLTYRLKFNIPDGDIFIHAGDFSQLGKLDEVVEFNNWLGSLPHRHKLVVAGNHELSFDPQLQKGTRKSSFGSTTAKEVSHTNAKSHLSNCIYLQDSEAVLYGIKFYGTPWQPEYLSWAFNLPRGEKCLQKWNLIPDDTDVLITHSPPLGYGDLCHTGIRAGCVELLSTIQHRVKPKYHIFGHIHEGYGITSDGETTFINAATCDIFYNPINHPIVFDMPLPLGMQK